MTIYISLPLPRMERNVTPVYLLCVTEKTTVLSHPSATQNSHQKGVHVLQMHTSQPPRSADDHRLTERTHLLQGTHSITVQTLVQAIIQAIVTDHPSMTTVGHIGGHIQTRTGEKRWKDAKHARDDIRVMESLGRVRDPTLCNMLSICRFLLSFLCGLALRVLYLSYVFF